tara:strand:+ start:419 stop:841 length:423 start_codon:yes stop_codon:yes gene_type:complete
MANRVRDVIKTVRRDNSKGDINNEKVERYQRELEEATEYFEMEKEKSESQKTHERYRRRQVVETGMSLESLIRPAQKVVEKPGTYFHGPLKKLAEEFNDIKTITAYMTMGQITKYSQKDDCLYDRGGNLVYNEKTQECFE